MAGMQSLEKHNSLEEELGKTHIKK